MIAAANRGRGFDLGRLLATPGILEAIGRHELLAALARHARGDWGDLCDADRDANDQALRDGGRLLSAYRIGETKIWIITEAADDAGRRAATTILLPEEY